MGIGVADVASTLNERAIVIGAGISGLAAAQVLSKYYEEVVILERDGMPAGATARPGVPQGHQAHGLLGGAMKALEELIPGFSQDLAQAGGVAVNPGSEALLEFPGVDSFPMRKWGWNLYSLTRPLIELTIRQRVLQESNVAIRDRCQVLGIEGTPDGAQVTGVRCDNGDGQETMSADLIVDASKHGGLTLSYLASLGLPAPEETSVGVDIRYATALYSLREGALGELKSVVTFPHAPEGVHSGYLLPVENNLWQLLLLGRGEDAPPADGDDFLAYAQNLSTPTIADAMRGAKRLSDVARYGFPASKWRHFGRLEEFPQALLPIGDVICSLNPVYGQGITVAVQEALALRKLLNAHVGQKDPFSTLCKLFLAETETLLKEPWGLSAIPDFVFPQTRGERPEKLDEMLQYQAALLRMASRDADLYELMVEVKHLLKPASVLETPELVRRVNAEMAIH